MLQSFQGIIFKDGLLSLRPEDSGVSIVPSHPDTRRFWAVMPVDEIPTIQAAIQSGERQRALRLVCERSRSIGLIVPS